MRHEPYWEISGPRRYLNIPTVVPDKWCAKVSIGDHHGKTFEGWGPTEEVAKSVALDKAHRSGCADLTVHCMFDNHTFASVDTSSEGVMVARIRDLIAEKRGAGFFVRDELGRTRNDLSWESRDDERGMMKFVRGVLSAMPQEI